MRRVDVLDVDWSCSLCVANLAEVGVMGLRGCIRFVFELWSVSDTWSDRQYFWWVLGVEAELWWRASVALSIGKWSKLATFSEPPRSLAFLKKQTLRSPSLNTTYQHLKSIP